MIGVIGLCESFIKIGYDVMFKVSLFWILDWYWRGFVMKGILVLVNFIVWIGLVLCGNM